MQSNTSSPAILNAVPFCLGWTKLPTELRLAIVGYLIPHHTVIGHRTFEKALRFILPLLMLPLHLFNIRDIVKELLFCSNRTHLRVSRSTGPPPLLVDTDILRYPNIAMRTTVKHYRFTLSIKASEWRLLHRFSQLPNIDHASIEVQFRHGPSGRVNGEFVSNKHRPLLKNIHSARRAFARFTRAIRVAGLSEVSFPCAGKLLFKGRVKIDGICRPGDSEPSLIQTLQRMFEDDIRRRLKFRRMCA